MPKALRFTYFTMPDNHKSDRIFTSIPLDERTLLFQATKRRSLLGLSL
ncbi:MAG: hypothetical protein AB1589_06080 [Cyanobacteriota bacterium]